MKTLHTEDFIEFKVLPYIIGFFALFSLVVFFIAKRKAVILLFSSLILFTVMAGIDFYRWNSSSSKIISFFLYFFATAPQEYSKSKSICITDFECFMYFFVIYVANTCKGHKNNFYKAKKNMTEIIEINLREVLYLHCEKIIIPIGAIHVTKTDTSGYRICR